MSPLSVLRIWGLGLFSWALLGLGIYLAVEAYDEFDTTAAQARVVDVNGDRVGDRPVDPIAVDDDRDVRDAAMADTAAELEESRLNEADARGAAGQPASRLVPGGCRRITTGKRGPCWPARSPVWA